MAVILRLRFGVIFLKGRFSLKNGTNCSLLATIQPFSNARAFLLRLKISEGCFVSDAPLGISRPYLFNEENSWKIRGVSWESTAALVKASGRGAKFYPRGEY
jgi:hypothetical protein